jgi:hypothetical protein
LPATLPENGKEIILITATTAMHRRGKTGLKQRSRTSIEIKLIYSKGLILLSDKSILFFVCNNATLIV